MNLPQTEIGKTILELMALSILSGLVRLFLLEKTIQGGWKQFFGGMVFGSLIGYLFYNFNPKHAYYQYCGKLWRLWCIVGAVFGKEILYLVKSGFGELLPILKQFLLNQLKRISRAWEAYKNGNDD